MSVQICCRDRRKMSRVIDRIKILADNVDELRAEINAFRTDYFKSREDHSRGNNFKPDKNSNTDILRKMKKYAKKVTSMYSLRKGLKSGGTQEPYYRCTNLDPPLSSLLNYIFPTGKRENVWHVPTRIKHLRDQGNQTNEKPESQRFTAKSPTSSLNVESIHIDDPLSAEDGNGHHNKIIFPRKCATFPSNFSEISCELDLQVESPIIHRGYEVNIFSDSYTVNNYPENMLSLSNGSNEQSSMKSTQANVTKLGRKYKNMNSRSKYRNDCFSKIKNAVITKKIVRNLNESTYTICEEVDDTKGYPNLDKERCKRCSCWKRRNKFAELNKKNSNEENFSPVKTGFPMLKTNLTVDKDDIFENLSEEEDLSSSSASVDLEVNISNSSNKIEDSDRRRPRTYVIHKKTQERNEENRLNHSEKSVIYVEQTSDLNLSSYNFSNHDISFN
ncbi:uncharacterized protein LOC143425876 [Xylocopa sonorina]|uniref:uncharacterized protein LOC143425876 n=1 Tax=Xylocopa sonorina TaxID=1818115 RepID=UPI00403ACF06